ncbi:Metalloprotease LoiP precursor [Pseudovibrio axinellae]|uniref:Metalloprotease LoiP n=1 Tax=Pseudovibrio axinellae TaxID=989403 RepID=A0A165Z5N0_9HYPH|nr:M48 family metallopeptidase [Pseudovibrio axinellae]KZL19531.1 Metalloprotease LoiP precursor [Pseudovibrio axinellae]SEQ30734.1 Peptidase family M48 [Pseudovibrio axinellae]
MKLLLGNAEFFDGMSAAVRNCQIWFDYDEMVLTDQAGDQEYVRWPAAKLHCDWSSPTVMLVEQNSARTTAYIKITEDELAKTVERKIRLVAGLPKRENTKKIVFGSLASIALIAVALIYFLPAFSKYAVHNVPKSWEEKLGKNVEETLIPAFSEEKICNAASGQAALEQMAKRLTKGMELPFDPVMTMVESKIPNALALPGGRITILSKTLEVVDSPDELAAVLAHELGHVKHRHSMQRLINVAGTGIVFSMFIGDFTGGSIIASVGEAMLDSSYSKDMEREADLFAVQMLKKAGVDPTGLASFLQKVSQGHEHNSALKEALSFLSSHPSTQERVDTLNQISHPQSANTPTLSDPQWENLKNICSKTSDLSA